VLDRQWALRAKEKRLATGSSRFVGSIKRAMVRRFRPFLTSIIAKISLDVFPSRSDECDDRNLQAAKEKTRMSTFTIDAENNITV
jgi:hypothetical protein